MKILHDNSHRFYSSSSVVHVTKKEEADERDSFVFRSDRPWSDSVRYENNSRYECMAK